MDRETELRIGGLEREIDRLRRDVDRLKFWSFMDSVAMFVLAVGVFYHALAH